VDTSSLADLAVPVLQWQFSLLGTVGLVLSISALGALAACVWLTVGEWRRSRGTPARR
jgi:hypothetical protein